MRKTININELIFEKIKFRYHFQTETRMRERNIKEKVLLDSFYPAWIAQNIANTATTNFTNITTAKGYAISERVATDLASKKLHISELTAMLGYTKTDIGKMLQLAKNKNYSLTLVGLGGTGSNVLHWIYEMMQWTGKGYIFDNMILVDDDDFDIPNMLRIPFIPQFSSVELSSKKTETIPIRFNSIARTSHKYQERLNGRFVVDRGRTGLGPKNKTVIYGAPDIRTREFLTELDYTFLAATHRDNEYSIVENPSVDNDLMMETYGKINLSMFFLNHLSMTIEFIKHLGERTIPFGRGGIPEGAEQGPQVENETIVRHNFADRFSVEMDNGFKAGSKKLHVAKEDATTIEINLPEEAVR